MQTLRKLPTAIPNRVKTAVNKISISLHFECFRATSQQQGFICIWLPPFVIASEAKQSSIVINRDCFLTTFLAMTTNYQIQPEPNRTNRNRPVRARHEVSPLKMRVYLYPNWGKVLSQYYVKINKLVSVTHLTNITIFTVYRT